MTKEERQAKDRALLEEMKQGEIKLREQGYSLDRKSTRLNSSHTS